MSIPNVELHDFLSFLKARNVDISELTRHVDDYISLHHLEFNIQKDATDVSSWRIMSKKATPSFIIVNSKTHLGLQHKDTEYPFIIGLHLLVQRVKPRVQFSVYNKYTEKLVYDVELELTTRKVQVTDLKELEGYWFNGDILKCYNLSL